MARTSGAPLRVCCLHTARKVLSQRSVRALCSGLHKCRTSRFKLTSRRDSGNDFGLATIGVAAGFVVALSMWQAGTKEAREAAVAEAARRRVLGHSSASCALSAGPTLEVVRALILGSLIP